MRDDGLLAAVQAFRQHFRAHGATAVFDRLKGLPLAGEQPVPVALQKIGLEGFNDVGEADHFTPPQPIEIWSIRWLMRSLALSLVWSVRWV